ncbi:MAG: sulfite exporter TauE/SafE family protein [Parvularculaceae bacterium]
MLTGDATTALGFAELVGVLLAAGLAAGFVAGLFGIGGGFVVVPVLLSVFSVFKVDPSVSMHVAIGTSLATIILTSARSVLAHHRHGAVDLQILKDWAPWLTLGVTVGLVFALWLDGHSLKVVLAAGLLLMGVHFIFPLVRFSKPVSTEMPRGASRAGIATFLGAFSALLGIGGGVIGVLVMTACGRTIHQAVATAAGFGILIALPGAIGFALLGLGRSELPVGSIGYINLIALAAIASMSVITAPLGARAAHKLNPAALKHVFGLYLIGTSGILLFNAFAH